ncbi:lipase like protein [Zymoseptoria brevis]|uniref:Carboxylic ester hydrolase n=1 Tax=Zymoseptoria brevis TaxID=1047168 RepID=A0A0F4GA49_9PEZI|nr:lipase like protein [Zymoseptoria brevis]
MYSKSFLAFALAGVGFAIPLDQRQATTPSATIKNGVVTGTSGDVESFSGIPFAEPPVGDLRLRAPRSYSAPFPGGTFAATKQAPACPQFAFQVDNTDQSAVPQSVVGDVVGELLNSPLGMKVLNSQEDCLTITVQRPKGTKSTDQLPVLYWIYGGGFVAGWSSMYDGTNIIKTSVELGQPIIYVAVNYRLGGYGFLHGKELAAEGGTNLGLRDQRLGMEWVADNIAAFGGDPSKVTIWGESAGAISVMDQTIVNGGDNTYNGKALFRGAIMNSGSIIPATDSKSPKAQAVYDTVVAKAGCSGSADTLACLRKLSQQDFQRAVTSVPGIFDYQSLNLEYLPRPDSSSSFFSESPEAAIQAGRFAKVPVIVGDQEDEGTLFSLVQSNITTNQQLINYFASYFPANPNAVADVTGLAANYPDQPLLGQPAGSPFRTGPLNSIYPQFKRIAAILGDITFTLTRRAYLDIITKQGVKAHSYLSTFAYGTPVLGTFHASDILKAFGMAATDQQAKTFQNYYVSFVTKQDPNALGTSAPLIDWPEWNNGTTQLLEIGALGNGIMKDDFRQSAYNYLVSRTESFRV